MLLSFYSACFAVSLLFIIPALAKAFSPRQNLMGSLIAQPVLIALVMLVDAPVSLWAAVPLLALAVSNCYVTLLSIASNRATADDQGQVLGVVSSINALAWGVAPIVTSLLQPHSIDLPVATSALVLVSACVLGGRFCNQAVELEVSRWRVKVIHREPTGEFNESQHSPTASSAGIAACRRDGPAS